MLVKYHLMQLHIYEKNRDEVLRYPEIKNKRWEDGTQISKNNIYSGGFIQYAYSN